MPRFSKGHYEDIAEVLRQARHSSEINNTQAYIGIEIVEEKLASMFRNNNPKFDIEMFFDACASGVSMPTHIVPSIRSTRLIRIRRKS